MKILKISSLVLGFVLYTYFLGEIFFKLGFNTGYNTLIWADITRKETIEPLEPQDYKIYYSKLRRPFNLNDEKGAL